MLEIGLLDTLLKEVTLFHIFILLVFPYSIFYVLDRKLPNGFDKFSHWEGALFMFSVGSVFYIMSIWLFGSKGVSWFVSYISLLIFFMIYLNYLYSADIKNKNKHPPIHEHMYRIKVPISIKLKNGNKYHGALRYVDNNKIVICITKNCPIMLKKPKMKEAKKLENVHEMYFKLEDVEYYYF
ncbi:MAG: hypothetical protein KC550_03165 [Nanoarchaeota archaeon]|nr:hypothetical protein [Nanoarchaeota archaeon]